MPTLPSLFLSYARGDDEPFVRRLYADLQARGFPVWFDREDMPTRGLPFPNELREAIDTHDRFVHVVGPNARSSPWCRAEWWHADVFGRPITPLVRMDGSHPDGTRLDGFSLLPEELRLLHAFDFRDDATYASNLDKLARALAENPAPLGKIIGLPALPAHLLARHARIQSLREALLADFQRPIGITGVHGMGGIGKSVLANLLARDPQVRRAFPDGVFWVPVGVDPGEAGIVARQWNLAVALGDTGPRIENVRQGRDRLSELLAGKSALLVLDDVWKREHAEAFHALGPKCRAVVTTRDGGLVTSLGGTHYQVQLLTGDEALTVLAKAAGAEVTALPDEAAQVATHCANLPLALALSGGLVRRGISWASVLRRFERAALEKVGDRHHDPENPQHENLWTALEVSVDALPDDERQRFAELSVFPLDADVPAAAVRTLWTHTGGLDEDDCEDLIVSLRERSLLLPGTANEIALHDLVHAFAARLAGNPIAQQEKLLAAYRARCTGEGVAAWATGPNDGYLMEQLSHHLIEAGRLDELVEVLCSMDFLEAKVQAGLAYELQEDYERALEAHPDAGEKREEERKRKDRLQRYGRDLVEYARKVTAKRKRLTEAGGSTEELAAFSKAELAKLEIPKSVRMWTDEEIEAESRRATEHPTQLDRLEAFAQFVRGQVGTLAAHGKLPGFTVQQAYNSASGGPVAEAAARVVATQPAGSRLLCETRRPPPNPRPATLRTLHGHTNGVESVALTADGARAVSASRDNTLRVWDLATGESLRTLQGHTQWVTSVAVTPDGARAVSASHDHTLRVWDLETGDALRVLQGHTNTVKSVTVTPDGARAVSASDDQTLRVWDLDTGDTLRTLQGHTNSVMSVAVTPDAARAVSAGQDNTLRVWDLETGGTLRTLRGHTDWVTSVAVTPDGARAVSASGDNTLRVWDLATGDSLRTLHGQTDWVRSVAVTPDGARAVSASYDDTLRVWDLDTGDALRALHGQTGWVRSVAVTPDGARAVSASHDHTLRVWDLETADTVRTLQGHTDWVTSVAVTPDGARAVSASGDNTLRVWDLSTGDSLRTLHGHTNWVRSVAVTPDGVRAVSASWDATLRVWDLETGDTIRTLHGHASGVNSVAVTPDGARAVSASGDNTLRVWDLSTGDSLRTLHGHASGVNSVAVTPDGACAVSASDDNTLRVWDIETGDTLRTLQGHTNFVVSVAVTPDGSRAVSASGDNTLRVWDNETGDTVAVLAADALLAAVAVSPANPATILVGDSTGRVHVLRSVEPGPPRAAAGRTSLKSATAGGTYVESLRRGLDYSRRVRGPDHEETLGHILALAFQLERMGDLTEASALRAEHDRLARLRVPTKPPGSQASARVGLGDHILIPPPHPSANPEQAAQLNRQYQEALAAWKALPLLKRIFVMRPKAPWEM